MSVENNKAFINRFVLSWNEYHSDNHQHVYDDNVELFSTLVNRTLIDSSGKLSGKKTVLSYWQLIKSKYPSVKMNLLNIFQRENEIIIHCSMPPLSDKVFGLISLSKENKIVKFKLSHV